METIVTIMRIGTSRGCIIPARILKKYNLKLNDKLYLNEMKNTIELRIVPSSVRNSAFDELHAINRLPGKEMSMDDILSNRHNKKDLVW